MFSRIFSVLLLLLPSLFLHAANGLPGGPTEHGLRKQAPADATPYLKFIENVRQWEAPVRYRGDLHGGRVWLRNTGFTFVFQDAAQLNAIHDKYYHDKTNLPGERIDNETVNLHSFHLEFLGANPAPVLSTSGGSDPVYNYFTGNDPNKWASKLRAWDKVHYDALYPGIGLDVYSQAKNFKYDFLVAAGANPATIHVQYTGPDKLFLADGNLHIETSVRNLVEMKPYAYQLVDGDAVEVPCEFVLQDGVLSFRFPKGYNASLPLVIDPTLVAATYSGSTATCYGHSATYDDLGNVYAAGIAFGVGFPTTVGAYQTTFGGSIDMGINKYNPTATALLYSTYIGGTDGDYPHSMIANNAGELCVLGSTSSANFPLTPGALDGTLAGFSEIAVCHLDITGSTLLGSTYFGGSADDGRNSGATNFNYGDTYRGEIIVDASDNILIASVTNSSDVPMAGGGFQGTSGGAQDGLIAKMSPGLNTLIWASYIGGASDDNANSIKINGAGELYVTGGTESASGVHVTPGSYNATLQGGVDGFLLHINGAATAVLQGTYLGGPGNDQGYFVEIDYGGFPYVLGQAIGYTVSPGVYSQAGGGLFVDKIAPALGSSIWSTTLGDATADLSPTAFLVDICGNIYAAGWGSSVNLPVTSNAYQPVGGDDFYLIVLQPNASGLLYATNFGGSGWEHVDGGTSRFDKLGVVYEASCSNSNNWPTTPGAVFPNSSGVGWDVVCFKFEFNFVGIAASFASATAPGGCAPFPVTFVNNSSSTPTTYYLWDFGTGDTDTSANPTYVYNQAGTYTITLIVTDSAACAGADTATLQIVIVGAPPLVLDQDTAFCYGDSIQLHSPILPQATYLWSPAAGLSNPTIPNPMAEPSVSTSYLLTVTDSAGCQSTGVINLDVTLITADAGPLSSFCEGEGGTQLVAGQPTGGSSPYYYTWWCDTSMTAFCGLDSMYDNDPVANPSASAWYYLQVTDFDGCLSHVDSVFVEILPKPIVDAGPDVGICQPPAPGALITATVLNPQDAPGPYTIAWTPSLGLNDDSIFSPYARPDTTTIYTAVVVSSNGCTSEATTVDTLSSITVTVHPQPIAEAGPPIHTCLGDSTVIQGMGFGAGPDYDYEWSPFAGLSNPSIANPHAAPAFTHSYILTVWSNGCPSIGDTMTLWVHTLPTPSAGPIREICLGDSVQLDAFGAGDSSAYYTYVWSPSASLDDATAENPMASPVSTEFYHLEVTSSWGCRSALDSVQVTVRPTPMAAAGPNVTICEGDSIQLMGGYYYTTTDSAQASQIYYAWTPSNNLSDSTLAQPWVWPTSSTMYTLDVRHSVCHTQDSMIVSVIPSELPLAVADTTVACEGVPIQFNASGGLGNATFSWTPATGLSNPNIPNPVATPDSSTTYTLLMLEGGCVTKAEIALDIIPLPDAHYLTSAQIGCSPFPVSFTSSSDNSIHHIWNFGDGTISNEFMPIHLYTQGGSYPVTLTTVNTGGCESVETLATIEVVDPIQTDFTMAPSGDPAATGTPLELFLPMGNVVFEDISNGTATTWMWDFGDGSISTITDPEHSYLQPGMYYVTLRTTNAQGCVSEKIHGPIVVLAPDLFVPNVFSPNGDGINDVFLVNYRGSQPFNLQIFDRWGVLLHQSTNKEQGWEGLNMQNFDVAEGVFYYDLNIGGKAYTGPITLVR
jgi:gliding motility-associated-like protein